MNMAQVKSLNTGIKFKDTPTGKVPVDWEVTQLGSIAQIRRGASPRPINDPKWFDGLSKEVDREFLYYYLQRNEQKLAVNRQGIQRNLKTSIISITYLPLPPLDEQKKIAEILSNADDAIEETSRIINKTKVLKKCLKQKLRTHGIGRKKYKKAELGDIPVGKDCKFFVPLLTGKEQSKVADMLSFINLEIENEVRHKQEFESLKTVLMQVLLTGKKRVKIT